MYYQVDDGEKVNEIQDLLQICKGDENTSSFRFAREKYHILRRANGKSCCQTLYAKNAKTGVPLCIVITSTSILIGSGTS